MSGWLKVVGLGPGSDALITPEVSQILLEATDIIGYFSYVARVQKRPGLTLHGSDNRVELDRSKLALSLAAEGKKVAVVSSGDPGVFAMAAAVFEAIEQGPDQWCQLDIEVLPGITAMLAASARAGAPLGHDFCAINLSDNLKPWHLIEKRLRLASEADFAMAFYNPRSKARPDETLSIVGLSQTTADMADMRTMVIVGSSQTRLISRVGQAAWVYTPRSVPE